MKTRKPMYEMTDAEFERYLKRRRITGMAAAVAATKRRRVLNLLKPLKEIQ